MYSRVSFIKNIFIIIINFFFSTDRVESQEYSNRQLFLATLFFTTLLFLLPTIITYYVVFSSVRKFL